MFYGLFHAFTTAGNTSPPAGWDVSSPTGGFIFLSTHLSQVGWGFVLYLMSFIGTIYVTWLILVARFVLLIGTAFAPVIIATSVYSEKAALFIWWSRKMIGALLVPMFAGAIMGVTTAIFWNLNPNLSTGTSWNPGSVVGVTASTPVALMLAVVSYVGGCWFLGQAIKHTTGLNLGAHSLSTMVAGGIGIQKIFGHGGPAQALFGMGAKGMEGVQALTTGSSNFIKDAKGAQMVDLPGASAAGGAGSGGATAFEAGSAMPTEIQNRLTALYQNTETVKNEITQSMPPAVVASIVGDKTGMDAITALVPEYIKTERGRDFLASGVFGAKTGV
jgi:hypothetical protein